jgi:hypothetical protein
MLILKQEMRRLNRGTLLVPWDKLAGKLKRKLEGEPMDVEVATNITRAELVPVIKNFYTH